MNEDVKFTLSYWGININNISEADKNLIKEEVIHQIEILASLTDNYFFINSVIGESRVINPKEILEEVKKLVK